MNVTFSTNISYTCTYYILVSRTRVNLTFWLVLYDYQSIRMNIQPEKSMSTLRETAAQCCKQVYIGAAVLPKQLFVPDFDDDEIVDGDNNITPRTKIKCATISTVEPEDDPYLSQSAKDRPPTRYAKVLSSEFNSVVIEHHLKWSPLVHT